MSTRRQSRRRRDGSSTAATTSNRRSGETRRHGVSSLLGVPLFYKLLVANGAVLLVGAAGTAFLSTQMASTAHPSHVVLLLGLLVVGLLLGGMALNALLIRTALSPLEALEKTARMVDEGDLDARVPPSPLADGATVKLVRLFNRMLDTQAALRDRGREQAAEVLEAEELERNRSSRELHDELAQTLAGVLVRLRVATLSPEIERAPSLKAPLDEIRDEVREALERVRDVARRLHPPELEELGLVPALEACARSFGEIAGVRIEVYGGRVDGDLEPDLRLAAFRIIQEALLTAIRHGHAKGIRVDLRRSDGHLWGDVVDDGDGFDPVGSLDGTALGRALARILVRAAIVGGEVTVESALERGTHLGIRIPVEHANRGRSSPAASGRRPQGRVAS